MQNLTISKNLENLWKSHKSKENISKIFEKLRDFKI